jgi:hypothetical protein
MFKRLATVRSRSTGRQTPGDGARCPRTVKISLAPIVTQKLVRYVTHNCATLSVRCFYSIHVTGPPKRHSPFTLAIMTLKILYFILKDF